MLNRAKGKAIIALILLASILATISPYNASVKGQSQATVIVLDTTGGSVDPLPGTYNYNDGTAVTLTATPDETGMFAFALWIISTDASNDTASDNPFTLTVAGGVTYTVAAVFYQRLVEPIIPPNDITYVPPDGVVVILHAVGGQTNPPEGTYYLKSAAGPLKISAVPDSGWKFSNWIISGEPVTGHGGFPLTLTPTENPYSVEHGFGYTFALQPSFDPVTTATTATFPTEVIIIETVVIIALVVAISAYYYTRQRKK